MSYSGEELAFPVQKNPADAGLLVGDYRPISKVRNTNQAEDNAAIKPLAWPGK